MLAVSSNLNSLAFGSRPQQLPKERDTLLHCLKYRQFLSLDCHISQEIVSGRKAERVVGTNRSRALDDTMYPKHLGFADELPNVFCA